MTVSDILDPSAITSLLPSLLPSPKKLNSQQDGLAAIFHSIMSVLGFRLIAIDDSGPGNLDGNNLPEEWNKNGPGHYTFRYKHDQSSLEFVLKVSKLGGRTLVNAIALESERATSLDISTDDFTSPSFFPHDLIASDAQPLVHGFISSSRVADLVSQFKLKIIQNLVPGLRKEGYTEGPVAEPSHSQSSNPPPARPQPGAPPYAPDIHPYRVPQPDNPLQIGRRDLDPIPINPFSPPPLFPGHGGDGMFVGPDHPIFGHRSGYSPGVRGPWGGDGFLPPMGAPPGARFDPVGPGRRGPGGLGGPARGNLFGGDPDNDEFLPPGAGDMFS